jgi:hypothetical protein
MSLWFIDGSEDEQMDQDDAVKVMEGVAHVVGTLPSDQPSGRSWSSWSGRWRPPRATRLAASS